MVGSTLHPASYCGILGFKPSFGVISRYGLMPSSRELDHVGMFARSVDHPPKLALILGPQWFQIEAEAFVGTVQ